MKVLLGIESEALFVHNVYLRRRKEEPRFWMFSFCIAFCDYEMPICWGHMAGLSAWSDCHHGPPSGSRYYLVRRASFVAWYWLVPRHFNLDRVQSKPGLVSCVLQNPLSSWTIHPSMMLQTTRHTFSTIFVVEVYLFSSDRMMNMCRIPSVSIFADRSSPAPGLHFSVWCFQFPPRSLSDYAVAISTVTHESASGLRT